MLCGAMAVLHVGSGLLVSFSDCPLYREGLVGWEGLGSVIGGSRRGRDGGRSRGGPGRGREGRGRHSGGRTGPGGGGRFDQDAMDFDHTGR